MMRNDRQPPRFVPTLTEVVEHVTPAPAAPSFAAPQTPALPQDKAPVPMPGQRLVPALPQGGGDGAGNGLALAQSLQRRVMERLDGVLEERLRYALADLVQLQTQALYQSIRQEVEALVSASVNEAVAQELAALRQQEQG